MNTKRKHIALAVINALAVMAATNTAFAQDAQRVERVEITGSSIKRADAETALPVTVIRREDIERSGAVTAQDMVNLIPANFGGTVIANNVGSTGNPSTANLRSLGSQYTLVLLNGRRLANYAFGNSPVDLNSIPLSAIERIEVLRDGASALYGADAIGGVINFILRNDYKGVELGAYGTKTAQGGGDVKSFSATAGFGDLKVDRFNAFITLSHQEDDKLKASERAYATTAVRPDLGINKASVRNGVPNLNFTDTLGNKYTGVNPYRYKNCDFPEIALVRVNSATNCGTDYVKFIDLIPKATHDTGVARVLFQVNPDNLLYAEAVYSKDEVTSTYSPAPYTKPMVYPVGGRFYPKTITIPKGYKTTADYKLADGSVLPAGTVLAQDIVVTPTGTLSGTWRTVAGGGRTDITESVNTRYLLGGKGTVAGWDYDAGYTYSKNEGEIAFGPGKFSYAKLTPLIASGAINVFGLQDETSLAALKGALLSGLQQSATSIANQIDLRASREIMQLPGGPVGLALGISYRKEELDQISYPVLETGDEVGGSGPVPSVTGNRKVFALFAETSIPLMKQLELQASARYDKYDNSFGTNFARVSPKVAIRYQPTPELVARASFSQGFRAPSLYEALRPFTAGNNTNGNYSDPIRCPSGKPITSKNPVGEVKDECDIQLDVANEGSRNLKPERSKQFSVGIAFSPSRNFSGSLDYWDVTISDAIVRKSEIQVFSDPVKYRDFFYRFDPVADPDGLKPIKGSVNPDFPLSYVYLPYENAAKFFAAGVDVSLNFRQKLENIGTQLTINFDGTLFTKHGYQYPGTPTVSDLGKYKDYGPSPRWRHVISVGAGRGEWFGSVSHNFTSAYQDFTDPLAVNGTTYPENRTVKAFQTWDTQIGWKGFKNLEAVFGIKNILDTDPSSSRTSQYFQVGYDAQFSNPLGRMYYLRLKYKFK